MPIIEAILDEFAWGSGSEGATRKRTSPNSASTEALPQEVFPAHEGDYFSEWAGFAWRCRPRRRVSYVLRGFADAPGDGRRSDARGRTHFLIGRGRKPVHRRMAGPARSVDRGRRRRQLRWNPRHPEARGRASASMSPSGAGNRCDVAPTRFKRFERDGYFTLDADWIIPALCRALHSKARSSSHALGAAIWFAKLRALGFVVRAAELYAYADLPVSDIKTGADVFELKSLAGYRFVVTNCAMCRRAPPPISYRARTAAMWRSWRDPNGALRRPAARSCTRMRGSPERCGSRNGPNGFARQSLLPATGSPGLSGRPSPACLAKTPFCASLVTREARHSDVGVGARPLEFVARKHAFPRVGRGKAGQPPRGRGALGFLGQNHSR